MRNRLIVAVTLAAFAGCSFAAPRFRVLLMGYTDADETVPNFYQPGELNGDVGVEKMKAVLEQNFGVPRTSMTILDTPQKLHLKSVEAAFEDKIIKDAKADDIVLVYYCGHGSKYVDRSKTTGRSCGLVLGDTRVAPAGGPDPSTILTGPKLRGYLKRLAKTVKNVTVVIDACHAASASRDPSLRPMGDNKIGGRLDSGEGGDGTMDTTISSDDYVCLFACQSNETAYSVEGDGPVFTLALTRALASGKTTNFDDLVRQATYYIGSYSRPLQLPTWTGSKVQPVFGAAFRSTPQAFGLMKIDGKQVLRAGSLAGMRVGYTVGLYDQEVNSFDGKPATTITLTKVGSSMSEFKWRDNEIKDDLRLSRMKAVVVDGLTGTTTSVFFQDQGLRDRLLAGTGSGYLSSAENQAQAAVSILAGPSGTSTVKDKGGRTLGTVDASGLFTGLDSDPVSVSSLLKGIAQGECVRGLVPSMPAPFKVEVRLVPGRLTADGKALEGLDLDRSLDGKEIKLTDYYTVAVRAVPVGRVKADDDVAINVLSISPAGTSKMVFPDPSVEEKFDSGKFRIAVDSEWCVLAFDSAGTTKLMKVGEAKRVVGFHSGNMGLPDAVETVKVFATSKDENMCPLTTRGEGDPQTELGRAIKAFAWGQSRDPKTDSGNTDFSVAETYVRPVEQKPKAGL